MGCNPNKNPPIAIHKIEEATQTREQIETTARDNVIEVDMYVNSPEGLRVRNSPNINGERIFLLKDKQKVKVIEINPSVVLIDGIYGYWAQVEADEIRGWVFTGYLTDEKEEAIINKGIRLEKVNEWIDDEKEITYISTLVDNQIFYREDIPLNSNNEIVRRFAIKGFIKNYLTGEITYQFDERADPWGKEGNRGERIFIYDQYGEYLFLKNNKTKELIIFDVKEKREVNPGEELKRPEYVYYTEPGTTGEYQLINGVQRPIGTYNLVKYNLSSRQSSIVGADDSLSYRVLYESYKYSYKTLVDIGNNQLRLDDDKVVQLNDLMTEVLSITGKRREMEYNRLIEFFIPIDENYNIGFTWLHGDRLLGKYYIQLLNERGKIIQEYKDITTEHDYSLTEGSSDQSLRAYCLVSPDKQHVLFFDYIGYQTKVSVYKIIY
jgi:hypothetical protein